MGCTLSRRQRYRPQNPIALGVDCPACFRRAGKDCVDRARHRAAVAHTARWLAGQRAARERVNNIHARGYAAAAARDSERKRVLAAVQRPCVECGAPPGVACWLDRNLEVQVCVHEIRHDEIEPNADPARVVRALERTIDQWERREEGVGC